MAVSKEDKEMKEWMKKFTEMIGDDKKREIIKNYLEEKKKELKNEIDNP